MASFTQPITLPSLLFQIDRELKARAIGPIVMLRNFEGLPETKPGNDIDVIVRKHEVQDWHDALVLAAQSIGADVKITSWDYYYKSYVFSDGDQEVVKFDLNFAFNWRGVDFADIDRLLDKTELYKEPIHVATCPSDRAFITFCHSFLYGGFIKSKYLDEFSAQVYDRSEFCNQLTRVFGHRNAQYLIDTISSGKPEISRKKANAMRISVLVRFVLRAPLKTTIGFARSLRGPVYETN